MPCMNPVMAVTDPVAARRASSAGGALTRLNQLRTGLSVIVNLTRIQDERDVPAVVFIPKRLACPRFWLSESGIRVPGAALAVWLISRSPNALRGRSVPGGTWDGYGLQNDRDPQGSHREYLYRHRLGSWAVLIDGEGGIVFGEGYSRLESVRLPREGEPRVTLPRGFWTRFTNLEW